MASKLKYNEDAAALTWEVLNKKKDIGKWELLYNGELISGKGFVSFLKAAASISERVNVIYVKYLRYFITVSENFIDYSDKKFFCNTEFNFYYIFCADNVELRCWDNFWDKIDDKEEFLKRLEICRTVFKGENKNRLSLETHYRYTISKEMWADEKYKFFLRTPEIRGFCAQMVPQDQLEFEVLNSIYKGSFYYSNGAYYRKNNIKVNYYDISSSHAGFMARKPYPCESFTKCEVVSEINQIIKNKQYCWYGLFHFERLQYKEEFPLDLTKIGFPDEDEMCSWYIYLTNVDIQWFKDLFSWLGCRPVHFYYSKQKPLAKVDDNYGNMFNDLYLYKDAQKKGTFAKEIYKFRTELPFGQSIKNEMYFGEIVYEDGEFQYKDTEGTSFAQIQYKLREKGLPMHVGVWTAAYSRLEFFQMVKKIGFDKVIYGDTDSVFFYGDEGIKIIEEHNKKIDEEFDYIRKTKLINFNPKMGRWLDQGKLDCFKIIATKWYLMLHSDNKLEVKASGVDTEVLLQFLKNTGSPFTNFELDNINVKDLRRLYSENIYEKTVSIKNCKKIDKSFKKELFEKTTTLHYYNPYEEENECIR